MIATALNSLERYAQWTDLYIERICPGDYVCLVLAHCPNGYKFDAQEAFNLDIKNLPVVILDFREYGWNTSHNNCDLAGFRMEKQPMYSGEQWALLHVWLQGKKIAAYFKREFSPEVGQLTPPFPVYPIDLISGRSGVGIIPTTKDEYLSRPIDIMHWWGYSHEDRVWMNSALTGDIDSAKYSCRNIPHLERVALAKVLEFQATAKMSLALPGCGHKTFRHSESCVNCVPVVSDCGMKFSVPWTKDNAVVLPTKDGLIDPALSVEILRDFRYSPEALWPRYQAAQESARLLDQSVYMDKFVNPLIQAAL